MFLLLAYRPDIDGLRAFAVLVVVGFIPAIQVVSSGRCLFVDA
jgi:peptidoglycan/LPS O-acetylase OafA/YrhL